MLAMSIIVMVVGAWFVILGIIMMVIHSRRAAELGRLVEEEGLTWKRAELESVRDQVSAERTQLRAAGKEGTVEWAESTAKLARVIGFYFPFGIFIYLKATNITNIVLGIALILVGVMQL